MGIVGDCVCFFVCDFGCFKVIGEILGIFFNGVVVDCVVIYWIYFVLLVICVKWNYGLKGVV